jgi:hypothetical protein
MTLDMLFRDLVRVKIEVSSNCILYDRCVYVITFCILEAVIFLLMVQQCTHSRHTAKLPYLIVPSSFCFSDNPIVQLSSFHRTAITIR